MPALLRRALLVAPWLWACGVAAQAAAPPTIVAAESTYGAIAAEIGGSHVRVVSLIRSPNVDPHAFEASPREAREVAGARLVLMNGLGYDNWMSQLLAANPVPGREVVVAADLLPARRLPDANPHVFYDPRVGQRMAEAVAAWLRRVDPTHAAAYAAGERRVLAQLAEVTRRAHELAREHPRLAVTATEPVWGYMVRELGWRDRNSALQVHIMNGTEPAPREIAAFDSELRHHAVALLIHNRQVDSPLTRSMLQLARRCGVPTLGVDEFTPPGVGYPQWLLESLQRAAVALARPPAADASCHG